MFKKSITIENIHNSYLIAYTKRKKTKQVIQFKQNLETNLLNLKNNVLSFKYTHKKYKTFIVNDSKREL